MYVCVCVCMCVYVCVYVCVCVCMCVYVFMYVCVCMQVLCSKIDKGSFTQCTCILVHMHKGV